MSVLDAVADWIYVIIGATVGVSIAKAIGAIYMAKVRENMIASVRQQLYEAVVRQDIGWHDNRNNSSGIITATLASDV